MFFMKVHVRIILHVKFKFNGLIRAYFKNILNQKYPMTFLKFAQLKPFIFDFLYLMSEVETEIIIYKKEKHK